MSFAGAGRVLIDPLPRIDVRASMPRVSPPRIEHRECDYCGFLIEGVRCPSCGAPAHRSRSARVVDDEHEVLPDPSSWSGR